MSEFDSVRYITVYQSELDDGDGFSLNASLNCDEGSVDSRHDLRHAGGAIYIYELKKVYRSRGEKDPSQSEPWNPEVVLV